MTHRWRWELLDPEDVPTLARWCPACGQLAQALPLNPRSLMAVRILIDDERDFGRLVVALLTAATVEDERGRASLARRYRDMAELFTDGVPDPDTVPEGVEVRVRALSAPGFLVGIPTQREGQVDGAALRGHRPA